MSALDSGRTKGFAKAGLLALAAASLAAGGVGYSLARINAIRRFAPGALANLRQGASNLLFDRHPALADRLPWRPLGSFPTPVEEMLDLPVPRGIRLWVKRDDLTSAAYGGNKVRKLEFFLAEAELSGCRTLITLGGIGSNHALATAVHGSRLGFEVDLVLYDQPVTPFVRKNLGGFLDAGARLHYAGNTPAAFVVGGALYARRSQEGRKPYFIMVGGTSRLGALGHVNAALELAQQIQAGTMPEPDMVFVPLGTCGTATGLIVGLKLAGLRTRVAAVRVADPFPANAMVVRLIAQDVADFLHASDPSIPRLAISTADFDVLPEYFGQGYGHSTAPGEAAVLAASPRLILETTYTGKTFAACLDHCAGGSGARNVLFWNSFSSAPVPVPESWEGLPESLQARVLAAF